MTTTTENDRHSNDTGAGHESHGNGNGYGHSGESQVADCNTQGGNGGTGGTGVGDACNGGSGGGGVVPVADCEPCDGAYHGSLLAVNADIDVSINLAGDILPCLDLPAICIDADAHAVV